MSIGLLFFASLPALLALGYLLLIAWALRAWEKVPPPQPFSPERLPQATILLPARNEAAHIDNCIKHLLQQNYPPERLSILVIDDHSTDNTAALAAKYRSPRLSLLPLSDEQAGKKAAIEAGAAHAKSPVLLTTDADCEPPPGWAKTMVSYLEAYQLQAVSGPVCFKKPASALQRFQALDFTGMMILTAAGLETRTWIMGNGASLAYRRPAFEAVNGYEGNRHRASGDDVFLLTKLNQHYPGQVGFLPAASASVLTPPAPDWPSFVQQRLRWGTKNIEAATRFWTVLALGLVFLLCWAIILSLALSACFGGGAILLFAGLLGAKAAADYRLLRASTRFFGEPGLLRGFWKSELLHTAYIAGIGLISLLGRQYRWKGRKRH